MFDIKTPNINYSKQDDFSKDVDKNDSFVLEEIVEYALNPQSNALKVVEALTITQNQKSILMMLLENKRFDLVNKVLSLSQILFNDAKILFQKDENGKDLLGYFIELAPYELLVNFLTLIKTHCAEEDVKTMMNQKMNDGMTHTMLMTHNHRFDEHEEIFKMLIDLIVSICGLDRMYSEFSVTNLNGDNILMLSIKNNNIKITSKIIKLIDTLIQDNQLKTQIIHKIVLQTNKQNQNLLILLCESNYEDNSLLLKEVLNLIQICDDSWKCIVQQDLNNNNSLMLSILHQNKILLTEIIEFMKSVQNKEIMLTTLCEQLNNANDNFLTLLFKYHYNDYYLIIMSEIEQYVSIENILKLFDNTLLHHSDFLHMALAESNIAVIVSIMKHVQQIHTISNNEKHKIADLLVQKDSQNNILLLHILNKCNTEIYDLIIKIACEFCDKITLKTILNSQDSYGLTPYMNAILNSNMKFAKYIENFAITTGNSEYIKIQSKKLDIIRKQQQASIMALAIKVLH